MRVLMVWDQGINYLLAKYLKPLGVTVDCIHRTEFDPFNMTPAGWKRSYPYGEFMGRVSGTHVFGAHVFLKALLGGYDVIHVHSFDKCVPLLSRVAPVVLHYHGTDIRGQWEEKRGYWGKATRVVVATRNLLEGAPPGVEFIPNPIDVEAFKPLDYVSPTYGAVYIDYDAADLAGRIAEEHGVSLTVVQKGIPYAEMPVLLNRFVYYVDTKRDGAGRVLAGKPTDTGSLVALQALACGCRVLTAWGERVGLPPEHLPATVAARIKAVYESALEAGR